MKTLQEAKNIVSTLLQISEPERSKKSDFQEFIWRYEPNKDEEPLCDILDDLAYDLDYYEPNPALRQACPGCYYDEQGLITNIEEALQAIKTLEIKNQNEQKEAD